MIMSVSVKNNYPIPNLIPTTCVPPYLFVSVSWLNTNAE
jgi:hypothetical protein